MLTDDRFDGSLILRQVAVLLAWRAGTPGWQVMIRLIRDECSTRCCLHNEHYDLRIRACTSQFPIEPTSRK